MGEDVEDEGVRRREDVAVGALEGRVNVVEVGQRHKSQTRRWPGMTSSSCQAGRSICGPNTKHNLTNCKLDACCRSRG